MLAQMIIEEVTRGSYQNQLYRRIIWPLGAEPGRFVEDEWTGQAPAIGSNVVLDRSPRRCGA